MSISVLVAYCSCIVRGASPPPKLWNIQDIGYGQPLVGIISQGTNLVVGAQSGIAWIEPSGSIRWSVPSGERVQYLMAAPDGTICVRFPRGIVLYAPDGRNTPIQGDLPSNTVMTWACDSRAVFYLSMDIPGNPPSSELLALRSDGRILWRQRVPFTAPTMLVGLDDRPIIVAQVQGAASFWKFNVDGTTYWRIPAGGVSAFLYHGDADGNFYAHVAGLGEVIVSPYGALLARQTDVGIQMHDDAGAFPMPPTGFFVQTLLEDSSAIVLMQGDNGFGQPSVARVSVRPEVLWRYPSQEISRAAVSMTGQIFLLSGRAPQIESLDGRIPPARAGWVTYEGPVDGSRRMQPHAAPGVHLDPMRWLPDVGFHLGLGCHVGKRYSVVSSTDGTAWQTVTNFVADDRRMNVVDSAATDQRPRIYRAVRQD